MSNSIFIRVPFVFCCLFDCENQSRQHRHAAAVRMSSDSCATLETTPRHPISVNGVNGVNGVNALQRLASEKDLCLKPLVVCDETETGQFRASKHCQVVATSQAITGI